MQTVLAIEGILSKEKITHQPTLIRADISRTR